MDGGGTTMLDRLRRVGGRLRGGSRESASKRFELRWDTIDASDLPDDPTLLVDLLDGSRDGVTITGVLDDDEVERALVGLAEIDDGDKLERPFGWLLGMPIGMLDDSDADRTRYLDDTERCQPMYEKAFGFDPFGRVADVLRPIADGMEICAPLEDGRPYNPGQVRWWLPGHGGLTAHVGNEFRRQLEHGAMQHLVQVTSVTNHLSYFVVLQQADAGGALSVYDLRFEDNEGRDDWHNAMPDDTWIDKVPAVKFDPGPGSMILFGGGWRWHRVDPPSGDVPRITYGGFAARSVDGRQLHFWS